MTTKSSEIGQNFEEQSKNKKLDKNTWINQKQNFHKYRINHFPKISFFPFFFPSEIEVEKDSINCFTKKKKNFSFLSTADMYKLFQSYRVLYKRKLTKQTFSTQEQDRGILVV